ncbi:hypothetical protein PSTG_06833 [Puccinia striiformis f. sp. tritici PST-78]|uniref:Uncharacterized protein n=1 Tax=Puccinia striiformis f. sp. tritici PST-78 TaxID=1165861 RepID=A0A0L0VL52_9BASI|nr:hypothetical protein PSTG_06833 [Puccinia striiformis f. sp. tritici PST-78]
MTDKIQSMSDTLKTNNQRANPSPSNETSALPATLTSSSTSNPPHTGVSTATASAPPIAKPTSSKRTRSQKATKDPSDAAVDKVTPALTGTSLTEAPTETDPATAVMASRISLDAGKALLSLPKPVSAPFSLLSSSLTHRPSSSPLPPLDDSDDTENEIHIKEAKQIASTKSAFAAYKIPKLSTESSDAAEWDDEAIAKLVERAIASAKAGNHEESDLYFSMYRSVSTMKKPAGTKTIEVPKLAPPPRTACTKSQAIVSRAQEIVEVSSGEESEAVLADGSTSLANISVFRPKIAHSCYATARKNGELEFTDNPYAEGGARAHWDPTTGAPKQSDRRTAPQKTPAPAQSTSTANLPAKPTKAPRGGGYKGSNFIENYKPVQSSFQGSKPAL